MPTALFTAQIDDDLKAELEAIARFDNRSASSLANHALRNFVEERIATRELLRVGLGLIEQEVEGVAPEAVREWLAADDERGFPGAPPESP